MSEIGKCRGHANGSENAVGKLAGRGAQGFRTRALIRQDRVCANAERIADIGY